MEFLFFSILWGFYSFLEGIREGYYIHQKSLSAFNKVFRNPYLIYIQRFLILGIFSYAMSRYGLTSMFLFTIGAIFVFSYIQNGTYFLVRNKLNPSLFCDKQSTTNVDLFNRPFTYLNFHSSPFLHFRGIVFHLSTIYNII